MVRLIAVGATLAALVAAGCGGSSSSSSSSKTSGAAPPPKNTNTVNPNGPEVSPAGDIPDNQAYVATTPPGGGYSVKVPEGWSQRATGKAVTFSDKLNSIRIESRPGTAPVTAATATKTELPQLSSTVNGFQNPKVSTVQRKSGPVVRITYLAKGAANPVTGRTSTQAVERYLFHHGTRDVVLTLSAPKGADNVDPWRIVTDSVRWTR